MRSFNENDKYDVKELAKLNAKPWQIDLLKLNPSYCFWGNTEDYMSNKSEGWDGAITVSDWSKFKFKLDEYNECVNFHFDVSRKSVKCESCDGDGMNPETKKISDDWYAFDNARYVNVSPTRRYNDNAWGNHITQDEVEVLVKHGRLWDFMKDQRKVVFDEETNQWMTWNDADERVQCEAPKMPTADEVNHRSQTGHVHDSLNQWICVEHRAKRLGVYGKCEHCHGEGHIYVEDEATVALQLWIIHPRKGCSRGVLVEKITEQDLPAVYAYLREAADRNAERFNKIPKLESNDE